MTKGVVGLFVLSLLLQPAEDKATVAGRVLSAETGRPIRGARVGLVSLEEDRVAVTRVADSQGRFEFANVSRGRYQLHASADRHVRLLYGQRGPHDMPRPIDIGPGERFDKADILLPRTSAIEGQIADEFGDPAPNVTVQVSRLEFTDGRRRLVPVGGRTTPRPTDDKGRFRIFDLSPGDYFVTALTGAFAEQSDSGGFAPTYYPGTADIGSARAIRVSMALDVTGLTFSLVPARMATVSGMLVDAAGQPVAGGSVMIVPSQRAGPSGVTVARATAGADGRFVVNNVPPGAFVIQALAGRGSFARMPFGFLPISVNGQDLGNVIVRVTRGVSARGQMVLNGDAPRPRRTDLMVFAYAVDADTAPIVGGSPPAALVNDDGAFEIPNLSGPRLIRVDVAGDDWTLERVTYQGRDVTDEPIDFGGKDAVGLTIELTTRASSVSGRVLDPDGRSVDYAVVVYAASSDRWTMRTRFVHLARPNQQGRYIVRGLPPEHYLAVALPVIDGNEWQDPEFLERMRPLATSFSIGPGEAKTLDLRLQSRR